MKFFIQHACSKKFWFLLASFFCFLSPYVHAASTAIPAPLEPWRAWVLDAHKDLTCPPQYANLGERFCRWPGQLTLRVDVQGASFNQTWQLYSEGWVSLPGDTEHWPQAVQVDGHSAVVLEHDGLPSVWLPAGEHRVQGAIHWAEMPTRLSLPQDSGLLSLTLNGKPVDQPSIDEQGSVLFGESSAKQAVADSLAVQVFRQVQDGIPLQMETVLRLRVAGRDREVLLGQFLLDGFAPLSLDTPLPARIEPDGRLRVQLRAGEWALRLHARAVDQPLTFSSKKMDEAWPAEEIWSWQADRSLRQVTPSAPSAMDPSQTDMPAEWRQSPAWLMRAGEQLTLTETQRGDTQAAGDTAGEPLSLQRDLWLDFDGGGITSRDTVSGRLNRASRFSTAPEQVLGRVEVNGEPQLITRLDEQAKESGIELRAGALNLFSVSRLMQRDALPVTGWQRDMNRVSASLHIPPGWMLLHAEGVDKATGSWLSRWDLWAIFLVLIVSAASTRLLGVPAGIVALLTMLLTYQTNSAPVLLWLIALIGVGLLRALPVGRVRCVVSVCSGVVFVALTMLLLDFAVDQLRASVYPQLELGRYASIERGGSPNTGMVGAAMKVAEQAMDNVPAAAPVAQQLALESDAMLRRSKAEPSQQNLKRGYDADAKIQTGPGEPNWRWQTVRLHWSGPVMRDQTLRLYWLSPPLHILWRVVSVLLSFLFLVLLLREIVPAAQRRLRFGGSKAIVPMLLLGVLMLQGQPVNAQENSAVFPSKELLTELEQRLTRLPDCAPQCASVNRAQIQVSADSLRINLQVDAQEAVAVPLPAARNQWQPRVVLVDDAATNRLRRDDKGQLWLALSAGSHQVVLEGVLSGDALQLTFPMTVYNASASAEGWQVAGISDGRIPNGSVQFTRSAPAQGGADGANTARLLPDTAPAFVRVTRTLVLGLDWQVQTDVERLAPAQGAISLSIPLLQGEAVLTPGVEVKDSRVSVVMAADTQHFAWSSRLPQTPSLTLTAEKGVAWVERWQWDVSPIWHAAFSGLNPIKQEARANPLPSWQPWPGEGLQATISRPPAVAGSTRTVESANLDYRPGARSADATLQLQVRSSQGGELPLVLPAGAQVQQVTIDGVAQSNPASPDGKLKLPLHPGSQQLSVSWRQETTAAWKMTTPQPQIDEPLNNIRLTLHLPEGRWLLAVGGPLMGPALLYWGVLAVVILVAILLGYSRAAPVATWQWLLLGIGMSTVNAAGSLLVVAWFVALARRATANTTAWRSGNLQLVQVGLVVLSVMALITLVGTIPASLLSSPDMQVVGNQSNLSELLWYQDRSTQGLPTAWALSVPMWIYRAVMLLWSLWLVFSLMKWCRWAWQCFSAGELWRSSLPSVKKTTVVQTKGETQS